MGCEVIKTNKQRSFSIRPSERMVEEENLKYQLKIICQKR